MSDDEQPDLVANLDQAIRGMKDIAKVTWAVYAEHRSVGFSRGQAFELAKTWFGQSTQGGPTE